MDTTDLLRDAYRAHYRSLVAQVYGLTGDLGDAQDVVQEAFARVLASPRGFLNADDQVVFLRVVALNVARSRFRRRALFDRLVRAGRVVAVPAAVPGMTPDRLALVAALRRLPLPTREVIVLHHLADLPVAEVAATLDIPVGTVKARLARGRAALARYLSDDPAAKEARRA